MEQKREGREQLEESFLLRSLPQQAVDFCLERGETQCAGRGAVLYAPGKFRRCLGLVLSGRVRVTRGELFVSVLGPGDWFGAAALFNGREEYPSTLTAQTPCRALLLSQQTVSQLMQRWPRAAENYIGYLSGRIGFLSDRLNSLAAGSAEEKVEQFLRRGCDGSGAVTVSATAVAQALGLGRSSVYRAFEVLERRGVMTRSGKTFRLRTIQSE